MKEQDRISEKVLNEMEISNLPDKEFKVMVIKMLMDLGREWMNIELQQRDRKYKKIPNRSHRAEEYNN